MVKQVRIGDKDFILKSSAYTMFAYKDKTGRDLLTDINSFQKINSEISKLKKEEQNNAWLEQFPKLLDSIYNIAYVMIKENNPSSYQNMDSWLKDLDHVFDDTSWFNDVIETAISPIYRRVQDSPNKQKK